MFMTLAVICGYIICGFIGLLGLLILWKIFDGSIDLSDLIAESNGGASMSRFQFLVFTFVVAISLFLVIVSSGSTSAGAASGPMSFPNIPATVLSLLGISGSSYLVSKGIQFSDPAGITDRGHDIVISPMQANVAPGKTVQFAAQIPSKPGSTVKWEVIAGPGTIDTTGLYTAPAVAPAAAPGTHIHATIQVTSDEFPQASDLAVVTIS